MIRTLSNGEITYQSSQKNLDNAQRAYDNLEDPAYKEDSEESDERDYEDYEMWSFDSANRYVE